MKKIIVFFFVLISSQVYSYEVPLTINWNADKNENWTEVRIYSRKAEENYNYELPSEVVPQTYENGESRPVELTRAWTFEDNIKSTIYWVARSVDKDGNQSEDSNEVSIEIDLTSLESMLVSSEIKTEQNMLVLSWSSSDSRITEFKLLFSENKSGPFENVLATIQNGEVVNKEINIPIDSIFPEGQLTTKYFMVRSYANYGLSSESQEEIKVTIDRRLFQKVFNLKINFTKEE